MGGKGRGRRGLVFLWVGGNARVAPQGALEPTGPTRARSSWSSPSRLYAYAFHPQRPCRASHSAQAPSVSRFSICARHAARWTQRRTGSRTNSATSKNLQPRRSSLQESTRKRLSASISALPSITPGHAILQPYGVHLAQATGCCKRLVAFVFQFCLRNCIV